MPITLGDTSITSSTGGLGFRNNTNNLMVIDGSGRVTIPNQPAFMAHGGATQTAATAQIVQFSSALYNQGIHYNTGTYRFTAPVAGVYRFNTSAMTWNGYHDRWNFRKNGSAVGDQIYASSSGGNYSRLVYEIIILLAASDYVEVWRNVLNESNSGTHPDYRHFSGELIG